jgi:hypothetical protein
VPGEALAAWRGEPVAVLANLPEADTATWNLEVENEHVYRVGPAGILVHNTCPTPKELFEGGGAGAAKTLPEVKFSATKYPELAENIRHAQAAGHPSVLTHQGNSAANRAAALDGVPNIRPLSRDEYPFASSLEGGGGSWIGHVPVSQQNAQGAILKNFFKQNNIKPGDQYRVVVDP